MHLRSSNLIKDENTEDNEWLHKKFKKHEELYNKHNKFKKYEEIYKYLRSLRSITISRACTRSQNLSKDASWRMAWHKVLFVTHSLSWKVIGFWMLDNIIWYATLDFMTFSIISLKKLTLGWLCLTLVPSLVV